MLSQICFLQYGFAKVRRGPETDMYAHPSFVRDQAETLSHLRKLTSTSSRRRARETPSGGMRKENTIPVSVTRSVSPSPSQTMVMPTANPKFHPPLPRLIGNTVRVSSYGSPTLGPMQAPVHQLVPASPESLGNVTLSFSDQAPPAPQNGRGRLDLLAMAMEQAAAMQ